MTRREMEQAEIKTILDTSFIYSASLNILMTKLNSVIGKPRKIWQIIMFALPSHWVTFKQEDIIGLKLYEDLDIFKLLILAMVEKETGVTFVRAVVIPTKKDK